MLLQLLIINVGDQDFRDMLFDYRITRGAIRFVQYPLDDWGKAVGLCTSNAGSSSVGGAFQWSMV